MSNSHCKPPPSLFADVRCAGFLKSWAVIRPQRISISLVVCRVRVINSSKATIGFRPDNTIILLSHKHNMMLFSEICSWISRLPERGRKGKIRRGTCADRPRRCIARRREPVSFYFAWGCFVDFASEALRWTGEGSALRLNQRLSVLGAYSSAWG